MSTALTRYDVAKAALIEAKRVDEVMEIRNEAERMRLYAKQAQDRSLIADANEIHLRAERRLGELLAKAKQAGQLAEGRPRKSDTSENRSGEEQFVRVTLDEVGISRKLSMRAQQIAEWAEDIFEEEVERVRDKIISSGAATVNPVKDLQASKKKDRRAEREKALAEKQTALPEKRYGVIYADPEWRFEVYSRETGMDRSPDNHYPTSSLEAIKARPVADIAADDCVLFLWVTVPHLDQGLEVLKAWGFAYKSHRVWKKPRMGTGYWSRVNHEILLIGTMGNVPAPAPGTQDVSCFDAPLGRHSEKPESAAEWIERLFPNLRKIELNARAARPGWDVWGNEAPEPENTQGESGTAREASGGQPRPDGAIGDLKQGIQSAPQTFSRSAPEHDGTSPGVAAPVADAPAAALAIPAVGDLNKTIRAQYAKDAPLADIAAMTGLSVNAVKQRAKRMGLGDRARQLRAVSRKVDA